MTERRRRASDHRALVLEAVATSPESPSEAQIVADCNGPDFDRPKILSMVRLLRMEGLIGLSSPSGGHFITVVGLNYLTTARFDRGLPAPHTRPGRKRRRNP